MNSAEMTSRRPTPQPFDLSNRCANHKNCRKTTYCLARYARCACKHGRPIVNSGFTLIKQVPLRLICTYVGPSTVWIDGYDRREMEQNRSLPPACNEVRSSGARTCPRLLTGVSVSTVLVDPFVQLPCDKAMVCMIFRRWR